MIIYFVVTVLIFILCPVCADSLPAGFSEHISRAHGIVSRDDEHSHSFHERLCISCVEYTRTDSIKQCFHKHNESFQVIFASRDLDRVCYVHEKQSRLSSKVLLKKYALPKWLQIHSSVVEYFTSTHSNKGIEVFVHLWRSSTLASFFRRINAVAASDAFAAHSKISSAWTALGISYEYLETHISEQSNAPELLDDGRIISLVIPAEFVENKKRELFWFVNKALFLDDVVSVSISQLFELTNYQATGMVQGGVQGREIYTSLLGSMHLRGNNQVVGVSDTGLDDRSCFFRDYAHGSTSKYASQYTTRDRDGLVESRRRKVIQYVNFADDHDEEGGHGTHVVGSIVGKSLDNFQQMDGVAPQAKVSFFDIQMAGSPILHIPRDLGSMFDFHKRAGSLVYSNSFGRPTAIGAYYDTQAYMVDKYIYEEKGDPLVVFSAGNYGFMGKGTVMSPGNSKNVLTVGAVTTRDDSDKSLEIHQLHIAPFSSLGPVASTLRKPDIVMNGDFVESAYASTVEDGVKKQHNVESCSTFEMSGTSMSAPLTSGCALLMRNYFEEEAYWGNLCPTSEVGINNSVHRVQTIRRALQESKDNERSELLKEMKARKTHSTCQQGSFQPTGYLLKALLLHASRKVRAYSLPLYNDRTIIDSFLFDAYSPPDNFQGYGYPVLMDTLPLSHTVSYEKGKYAGSTGNGDLLQQKFIREVQENQPDLYVWEFLIPQNSTLSFSLNYSFLSPFQAIQREHDETEDDDNDDDGDDDDDSNPKVGDRERSLKSIPLKATLVWPDPPSSSGFYGMTQYLLLHDLDLVVINRDKEVAMYGSCNLKRDAFDDKYPCIKSDSANNNEQIIIHEPQAASYEVVVQSHYYPQDVGDQKVALVLTVDPAVLVSEPKLHVNSSVKEFLRDRHTKDPDSNNGGGDGNRYHNNSNNVADKDTKSDDSAAKNCSQYTGASMERGAWHPSAYFSRRVPFNDISLVPMIRGSPANDNHMSSMSEGEQFVPTKHLLDSFLMNRQSRLLRVELKCRPLLTNSTSSRISDDSPSHPRQSVSSKTLDPGTQCWALAVVIRSEQDMVRIKEDQDAFIPDVQITRFTRHQCIQAGGLDFVACAADYYGRRWPSSWLFPEGGWPVTKHSDASNDSFLAQFEAQRDLSPADFFTEYPTLSTFESLPTRMKHTVGRMDGAIRTEPSHPTPPSEPETYPGRIYIELSTGFTADSSQNVQSLKYSGEVVLHYLDETILFQEKEAEENKEDKHREQMMTINLYVSIAFLAVVLLLGGLGVYANTVSPVSSTEGPVSRGPYSTETPVTYGSLQSSERPFYHSIHPFRNEDFKEEDMDVIVEE